jgi:ribonuclease HI/probable phosphoglycerate mutase
MMQIWIDGSPALRQNQQGRISMVYEDGRQLVAEIGSCTNNEAEYLALIEALRSCNEGDVINTDSELLVGQLTKGWKVNAENLREYYKRAKALIEQKRCKLALIRREENKAGKLMEGMPSHRHTKS